MSIKVSLYITLQTDNLSNVTCHIYARWEVINLKKNCRPFIDINHLQTLPTLNCSLFFLRLFGMFSNEFNKTMLLVEKKIAFIKKKGKRMRTLYVEY